MTIDDFIARIRGARERAGNPSFLVYTRGSKGLFHGELVDNASAESILLRQADGAEVLIVRHHIVAITAADDAGL